MNSNKKLIWYIIIILFLTLWFFSYIFSSDFYFFLDHNIHISDTIYFSEHYWIDTYNFEMWNPSNHAGFSQNTAKMRTGSFITALLTISFGIKPLIYYKLLIFSSIFFSSLTFFFMIKKFTSEKLL